MNKKITELATRIEQIGGIAYFVGGYVRDKIMGIDSKDIDIEVFGLGLDELLPILKNFGEVKEVGKSFGVYKVVIDGIEVDVSIPRRETKTGIGYKSFDVTHDKDMTVKEAALRRDFTFNAIYTDVITGEMIDEFNGIKHITNKTIMYVSPDTFGEDPLRVLRAMQFAGRFDFQIQVGTCGVCYDLKDEFHSLPKERIWIEFEKLFKSKKPSRGVEILEQTEWIEFFPEIAQMGGLEQDPEWHPEGDVLTHTKLVMDEAARLSNSPDERLVNVLAALCHDMGKAITTEVKDGRIISPKHAKKGVDLACSFMEQINTPNKIKNKVLDLVREHMATVGEITKRTVRRLIHRMNHATMDELMVLIEADHSGRPPLPKELPEKARLIKEFANEIGNEIKPILMGRHLIQRGLNPSKQFGEILKKAQQAQLDGVFEDLDGALIWLNKEVMNEINFCRFSG